MSPGPPVDDASASTGRTVLDGFESSELTEAFEGLYQQLKTMARGQLRKRARGGTLCTTELVHELYLRFTRQGSGAAVDRSHFMALSARAMRHIIIDHARERVRVKRGGEQIRTQLDEHLTADDIDVEREATFLLAFDQALEQLGQRDPRLASTCELRFFGGFSTVETAEILGVSTPTVKRDYRLARLFLSRALEGGAAASERV
ncbi:MAG: ECF-type sigma factor [Acidobacteriota bacterium]